MSNTISPNMNLVIPGVGTEPGPDYASDVNTSLSLIDQHDHSPGKGVQITPAGLNINAPLPLNSNFLVDAAGVTLTPQSSTPAVNTIYESGIDLFYVDGLGNNIRITQSGAVAGTPGSIANLVPPASASYVAGSKTFVWQSGTNLAANMDFASATFRNISPNSTYGITVQPPDLLGSNWNLTLPPIPTIATGFLQLDTTGVITAPTPISHGLTNANIALGMQVDAIVQTVITTDTVNFNSNIVNASTAGGPYTLTMYSAVGNGQTVRIRKTSTDFNVLTINLVGASTSTTTLNTFKEEVELTSNGSDWLIVSRTIPSAWVDSGTVAFTGTSSNPTKGAILTDKLLWMRVGNSLSVRIQYQQTTAGGAGSGIYLIPLPAGLTIDTSLVAADSSTSAGFISTNNNVGSMWIVAQTAGTALQGNVIVFDSLHLSVQGFFGNGAGVNPEFWGSTFVSFASGQMSANGYFNVPILGWNS